MGGASAKGWNHTACGIYAHPTNVSDEWETDICRRIEAKYNDWSGVTCGRCLKNPHAKPDLHKSTS
jgi:hypothetical protein